MSPTLIRSTDRSIPGRRPGRRTARAIAATLIAGLATAAQAGPPPAPATGGGPEPLIRFVPGLLDLGHVVEGESADATTWLRNTTDRPLEVVKLWGSCGCMSLGIAAPLTIEPNGAVEVPVTMRATAKVGEASMKRLAARLDGEDDGVIATANVTLLSIHRFEGIVRAHRRAVEAGDESAAAAFIAPGARLHLPGDRDAGGTPLSRTGEGPWSRWGRLMNAESRLLYAGHDERTITFEVHETNDYYRLLDRPEAVYRVTWGFDEEDRIVSKRVQPIPGRTMDLGRTAEFMDWALEHHAAEMRRLRPGGMIDPSGDNALRWRELLVQWREEAGLPPVRVEPAPTRTARVG